MLFLGHDPESHWVSVKVLRAASRHPSESHRPVTDAQAPPLTIAYPPAPPPPPLCRHPTRQWLAHTGVKTENGGKSCAGKGRLGVYESGIATPYDNGTGTTYAGVLHPLTHPRTHSPTHTRILSLHSVIPHPHPTHLPTHPSIHLPSTHHVAHAHTHQLTIHLRTIAYLLTLPPPPLQPTNLLLAHTGAKAGWDQGTPTKARKEEGEEGTEGARSGKDCCCAQSGDAEGTEGARGGRSCAGRGGELSCRGEAEGTEGARGGRSFAGRGGEASFRGGTHT